ncbi:MAG: outer membrane protein assembly factor BamD [Nevskia sp.]|nr:outer membrane protein assembly factor BamD [Nevskia sp.]
MTTLLSSPGLGRLARLAAIGLLVAGCSSNPDKADRPENPFKTAQEGPGGAKSPLSDRELRQQAGQLYRHAREALDNSDYAVAITRYDTLIARYPFSDYSTQAELERIYADYKSYKADEAVTAADRFLRSHPRHPSADYVMYLKGCADFNRDDGVLDNLMPSNTKRDIGNQRRAFEDFALLVQRYPNSKYIGDARRRMLFARNRIADHELSVAQFYVTRGAYVAAAKRATDIITEYPGAPATADALKILQRSYSKIGLNQEAKDTATLIAMNSDKVQYTDAPKPGVINAPVVAAAPAETAAAGDQPQDKPGLMSRFAGMFGVFDTTKPENQHTVIIGGDKGNGADAKPASGASGAAAAGSGVTLSSGFDQQQAQPQGGDSAKAPAKDADSNAAQPAEKPQKKGFFTWFAGLFSVFDSNKSGDPAPPKPAADGKAGAASNADTTK